MNLGEELKLGTFFTEEDAVLVTFHLYGSYVEMKVSGESCTVLRSTRNLSDTQRTFITRHARNVYLLVQRCEQEQ